MGTRNYQFSIALQEGNVVTEYKVIRNPKREPTHPGAVLGDVLEDTGLSISAFARGIHISRQMAHRILAGEASVSPEVAVKIGLFLGNGSALWLNLQVKYDLWTAEQNMDKKIEPYQACG